VAADTVRLELELEQKQQDHLQVASSSSIAELLDDANIQILSTNAQGSEIALNSLVGVAPSNGPRHHVAFGFWKVRVSATTRDIWAFGFRFCCRLQERTTPGSCFL
jgi:hypothetical protein